jgi:predicted SPOUT superfamily RNA methylase MTH1
LRVTVKIPPNQENPKKLKGIIVPPTLPKSEAGIYWGYTVKLVSSLSEIFLKCPYPNGYDYTIGTSDKGTSIDCINPKSLKYKHMLIVFGGVLGIEEAITADSNFDFDDTSLVFNEYLNTCPQQGSRTIRTEEAVLITLAELRTKLIPEYQPVDPVQSSPECKSVDPVQSSPDCKSTSSDSNVTDESETSNVDF